MVVALVSLNAAVRASGGVDVTPLTAAANTVNTSVAAIVYTTVAANVATLVADAAAPTQAHVTTLNTNWGLLVALIDAAVTVAAAAQTAAGHKVTVTFDKTDITNYGHLQSAFNALLAHAAGAGYVR